MAKKHLGYVHLEWTCPNCDTRNPGPHKFCNGCGAPQPEEVAFEQPLEEKILTDEAEIARAKIGPDVHCPYCEARNAADAKFCGACGGDLTSAEARESGRVLGAHRDEPAADVLCAACGTANPAANRICANCGASLEKEAVPDKKEAARAPKPAASARTGRSRAPLFAILGVGLLCVLAACAIFFLFFQTDEQTGQVSGVSWERSIPLEALAPVEREAWVDEIPDGAVVEACTLEYRSTSDEPEANSTEVCGTPYTVDEGSGFGEVVQDCVYEVYDDRCTYTVMDWEVFDTVTLSGTDLNPRWPEVSLTGDQRQGDPTEEYVVTFTAQDGTYTYTPQDADEFSQFGIGTTWILNVNALGGVSSVEPAR